MNVKSWKGGGIIAYYVEGNKKYALVGKETKYLSDFEVPIDLNNYEKLENNNQTYKEVCEYYSKKAKELSEIKLFEKKEYISYDEPKLKDNEWKVNMRIVRHENQKENYGMPKGGKNDQDKAPIDTAVREFEEEVGYKIGRERLKFLEEERQYYFYHVKISKEEMEEIKGIIEKIKEKNEGEMHELQFIEISEIKKNINKFNGLGRKVFGDFVNRMNEFF
jgi:8-oxo-dGTP pyrophosphatase MutT (NUDIX family)